MPEIIVGAHGSSPLSRGILFAAIGELFTWRIIPALAGNTGSLEFLPDQYMDHPRSRGEYVDYIEPGEPDGGSSPLSRGIRGWY